MSIKKAVEGVCPCCESNNIMYGNRVEDIINNGEVVEWIITCKNCGKKYVETWRLILSKQWFYDSDKEEQIILAEI
jgi:C4-type Zn-finger protein